jgi:hypothetical protein
MEAVGGQNLRLASTVEVVIGNISIFPMTESYRPDLQQTKDDFTIYYLDREVCKLQYWNTQKNEVLLFLEPNNDITLESASANPRTLTPRRMHFSLPPLAPAHCLFTASRPLLPSKLRLQFIPEAAQP